MDLERKAISALKWTAAARLLGQLASWLITLVVIRILDPGDYGLMAMTAAAVSLAAAVAEFGLGPSIVQRQALPDETLRKLVGFSILLHLVLAVVVASVAPVMAWYFGDARLAPLVRFAALHFVFAALAAAPHALAMRSLDFKLLAQVDLGSGLFASVVSLALALADAGAWALVGAAVAGAALRAGLLAIGGDKVRPDFRFVGMAADLKYSSTLATSHILWSALNQCDAIIGGRILSREALGTYSVALNLALLPMNKILGVINQVAFSAVARLQDEAERLQLRLLQSLRLLAASGIAMLWGLTAVAPELVRSVLGAKWEAAILPLQLIGLIVPFRLVMALLSTAVAGIGRADVSLRNTVTAAIIWPLCFLLGAQFGATGLAAAWLGAVPLSFAFNSRRVVRALGFGITRLARCVAGSVVAGTIMLAAVAGARAAAADLSDVVRLGVLIAVGAAVYLVVLVALDRELVSDARRLLAAAKT
ncbi:hypothetical protein FBR04_00220 [Betaproteobacteria bacterium PRO7]|jgi:O-antigen/teichoic acid export membrane protein|nr:hypothetical protein [Betaproteobacteria bacterium PRO7]